MKYRITRYKQNNQEYVSVILPFEYVDKNSTVLVYDRDEDGYQRIPNKLHYSKIKKYILSNFEDYKLPTSIILGVDKKTINEYIETDNCGEFINLNLDDKETIFRVVDGQHRLSGLREASIIKSEIKNVLLNIIIVVSEENKKSIELEIFNDINSTAKRISTDLSTLAKYKYKIKEGDLDLQEVPEFISISSAYELKELKVETVWTSAIRFDIHSEISIGSVGVTAFIESIKPIVAQLLEKKYKNEYLNYNGNNLIEYCINISKEIADHINLVWSKIIFKKWKNCFEYQLRKDEFGDIITTLYSDNFYIQKTIGVKVLNILYSEILKDLNQDNVDDSFEIFEELIEKCRYNHIFWKRGGVLSGLSSESGFSKAREMIKKGDSNSTSQVELF